MTSWMNDAAAVQNHNGAAFNNPLNDPNAGANAMLDPSAFMVNPNSFDPSQFQNQQLQQRMQNGGGMRNTSPAFNNPVYQTNPVVPSKRARPREDSLGQSPRQPPGMLPNSRSQTPQQAPYQGFPPNGQPQQSTPYSHLQQNGSGNASPSPVMNNQLRPGAVPQRVSTASPHPFSPATQQFAHASPSQSDHGSRVDTPQNPYMQQAGFPSGFNQPFTPGRTSAPPQGGMPTPQMPQPQLQQQAMYQQQQQQQPQQQQMAPNNAEQQKMVYQMQLQQQMAQRNLMQAQRMQNMPQNPNQMRQQMQAVNGQPPQRGPGMPAAVSRPNNPEQFMKHLTSFMQSRGLQLDMNPIVGDRSINLVMLYMAVTKLGGYRAVNQQNQWPHVSLALHFNPAQNQGAAPQQLKGHYERNLMLFEEAYNAQQVRQKQMMQQRNANMGAGQPQMSPTKQMPPQLQQQQQFMQQQAQNPMMRQQQQQHQPVPLQHPQGTPVKQMSQPAVNGFSTPQAQQQQQQNQHQANAQAHARNSLSRTIDATPPQNGPSFTMPSPASVGKHGGLALQSPHPESAIQAETSQAPVDYEMKAVYDPSIRVLNTWGGVACDELKQLVTEYVLHKPNVPGVMELGVIDIHALTMSLQSGIHAEVRLALDTLATISVEQRLQLDLKSCEDLVETIIDCAEVQVDLLAENAAEVSDMMLISSYEDVVRGCRLEQEGLQDTAQFGTLEYDLDRSVERLICITTILRNWSFYETNHPLLADDLVIKFMCVVIRYLGTRNMLLRTHANTLDFMKDIIIFLSNLAQAVEIPGKEQALCLLHFLLAFAPCPPPNSSLTDKIIFSPYDPAIQRYLPPAVDSLAKLLARDEPNRTYYKTLFASESTSTPPYDLLTKAFALAISPIPGHRRDEQRGNMMKIVEARKPHLMQGMLAAEILSNLVPGYETKLAEAWLTSEDGFAQSLLRLVTVLSSEPAPPPPPRGAPQHRGGEDDSLLHITLSGITVLRRLAEKSKNPDNPDSAVPLDGMIKQENLLGALLLKQPAQPRPEVIKQLCLYAALDR
jgi:SWI/SNF chromatin-remodeling complex subunit SWI1